MINHTPPRPRHSGTTLSHTTKHDNNNNPTNNKNGAFMMFIVCHSTWWSPWMRAFYLLPAPDETLPGIFSSIFTTSSTDLKLYGSLAAMSASTFLLRSMRLALRPWMSSE